MGNSQYKVRPAFPIKMEHGEGPLWLEKEQQFQWVDLHKGKYYRAALGSPDLPSFSIGQDLGAMAPRNVGGKAMAARDGFGLFDEDKGKFELVEPSPILGDPTVRFNDGIVSPVGQFWAGTMEWEGKNKVGKLYRLNKDHSYSVLDSGFYIPNGMGWNVEEDTFFMIDTGQNCLFAYDYDRQTDAISNRRVFVQLGNDEFPDGMCLDSEDHFWVAMWQGGRILHLDAEGKKVDEILLPVPYPTSCCFGGKDLNQLFITSSKIAMTEEEVASSPLSGSCFWVEMDQRGKLGYDYLG